MIYTKNLLQDGTTLTKVASHLKQMHIIDALGTSVDRGQVLMDEDTGYQVIQYHTHAGLMSGCVKIDTDFVLLGYC